MFAGEELGIKLLRKLAAVHSGKQVKNPSTLSITLESQQLPKEEYDKFYYLSQIGNLIVNLSKQATTFVCDFFRFFNQIECQMLEIARTEKTIIVNKQNGIDFDASYLMGVEKFLNAPSNNGGDISVNYFACATRYRELLATNTFIKILMKAYKLPFMKTYITDDSEIKERVGQLNNVIDELHKLTSNKDFFAKVHKINLAEETIDKEMVTLTEKVAILSRFDSLILTWCSDYEVILNNILGFSEFDNPDWIKFYVKSDGTKYGTFKYPERSGMAERSL